MESFDVIIVGAGHAGIEASLVCARKGLKTLVLTQNLSRTGFMSCNPSIGGLAKGHIVRELDVLGGEMAKAADETCVQFKRLNAGKGPAVRGSRTQNDKNLYTQYMSRTLSEQKNLTLKEAEVKSLIIKNHQCVGVRVEDGSEVFSKAVIITAGTFMNGVMYIGEVKEKGGRIGDKASVGLSDQISEYGFCVKRLKTGTPPRLYRDSIDWSKTQVQKGDDVFYPFSFTSSPKLKLPQIDCFLTKTNEKTHEIIAKNLKKSPIYGGIIDGVGPRYCPSIEDKIVRFSEKNEHQTFLEPEGIDSESIYLQGISTSLPENIQYEFLHTIAGLENVKMIRPGYAVEYDFIEPTQIWHTLETRQIKYLYFAGQVNGSSGYEEAAAQGFVAGVNAAHKILEKKEFILGREEAYIGVLIDDLVTKGTKEPYRMFTSRAEHRLMLREDNTVDRLSERGYEQGVLPSQVYKKMKQYLEQKEKFLTFFEKNKIYPNGETQKKLANLKSAPLSKPLSLKELLRRSEIHTSDISLFCEDIQIPEDIKDPLEIEIKYEGYIKRQKQLIEQTQKMEEMKLPQDIDYGFICGLSVEEKEKLNEVKPRTIGQAQRISGVNPSAIQSLLIYLKGHLNR